MKTGKMITALVLAGTIGLSCSACGKGKSGSSGKTTETTTETTTESTAETASESTAANTDAADIITDYSDSDNWAMFAEGQGDADVFFICPTVDMGTDGETNMSLEDEEMKESFLGASNMELGIYDENAVIYVPYYRQAAFTVYSMEEDEAEQYFDIAYEDVSAAFAYYLEECDPERPLILAGFSQGSDMLIRLMEEYFEDEELEKRLVAAYAIGWRLTHDEADEYPWLVPASTSDDIGCIVSFNSEAPDVSDSLIVPEGTWTYSINPLNWTTEYDYADPELNKGSCFTDYSGEITEEIQGLTGAYIDVTRGTLKCPEIDPEEYPGVIFPDGVYHLYDYEFFYRNLQENVAIRLDAWETQCSMLEQIEEG